MSSALPTLVLAALALALGMARPAAAQMPRPPEPDRPAPPMLTVTGRGDVAVAPDEATVRMGAIAQADQAAEAQDQVNQVMQRAVEKVRGLGVPAAEIQTAGLSLQPVYEPPPPGREHLQQPRVVAYRASNTIQVRLTDLSRVGAVIDAAVASGANQLESINFGLKDDTDARMRALQQAVTSARAKAKAMADAAGIQLGQVQEVIEGTADVIRPQFEMGRAMRAMAAPAAATPVQPGQVRVETTVTLRYRILPPAAMMP